MARSKLFAALAPAAVSGSGRRTSRTKTRRSKTRSRTN